MTKKLAVGPTEYTTAEVAEIAGVTRRTVYAWITEGRLPAHKIGPKLWRVLEADLKAFMRRQQIELTAQAAEVGRRAMTAFLNQAVASGHLGTKHLAQAAQAAPVAAKPQQPELPAELLPQGSGRMLPPDLGAKRPAAAQPQQQPQPQHMSRAQRRRLEKEVKKNRR